MTVNIINADDVLLKLIAGDDVVQIRRGKNNALLFKSLREYKISDLDRILSESEAVYLCIEKRGVKSDKS